MVKIIDFIDLGEDNVKEVVGLQPYGSLELKIRLIK